MLFQGCARDFTVLHKPEPLPGIPPSACCCFGLQPHRNVSGFYTQRHKGVHTIARRRRLPFSPFDNQLDRLQPLPQRCVVPGTNAQQGLAVFFHEVLGTPLPRLKDQPRFHLCPLLSLCQRGVSEMLRKLPRSTKGLNFCPSLSRYYCACQ